MCIRDRFTDSTYVIRGITQWIWGWKKRGWKTASGSPVTNQDLWRKLLIVTSDRETPVTWRYVPGHAGIPGNERCDRIAVDFSKHRRVRLFKGHEADYNVDLTQVPAPAPLPEMRKRDKKTKKKAHSYLSEIGGDAAHQELATGFVVGSRFHSAPVVRLADAKPMQLGEVLKADGRWRILAFADSIDTGASGGRLADLCRFLGNDDTSPLKRYTPDGSDPDSVIDLRVVFQMPHRTVDLGDLPSLLLPAKGRYKLIDYEKVFCSSTLHGEDIFERRGIDRLRGVMVVVRPDQFIALVLPLEAHDALTDFFGDILIEVN